MIRTGGGAHSKRIAAPGPAPAPAGFALEQGGWVRAGRRGESASFRPVRSGPVARTCSTSHLGAGVCAVCADLPC